MHKLLLRLCFANIPSDATHCVEHMYIGPLVILTSLTHGKLRMEFLSLKNYNAEK